MASPDVFRSSPLRPPRSETLLVNSSSPDLPPMQDLVSQVPRRPPIRSGSKAKPIPDGATSTFTSAKEHWKSAQAASENGHASASVIEDNPKPAPKPRKPQRRKEATENRVTGDLDGTTESSATHQPWKKYKSSPGSRKKSRNTDETGPDRALVQDDATAKKTKKSTGSMSNHFQNHQRQTPEDPIKADGENSLHLELAPKRRADWTPPPQKEKTIIDLNSAEPTTNEVNSSATESEQATVFKNLLENYGCSEQPSREAVTVSDEDSSFLKKRKLVEFVNVGDTSRSVSAAFREPSTKQKAPKKKPRTITGLATAAYRPATQVESMPTPESLDNSLPKSGEGTGNETNDKGKAKSQGRKKTAKKSKKKPSPPRPILLSPGTALQEVSKQDFVFGTSSQLAREQSPSLLRDIQSAIQNSNGFEISTVGSPLNSDAIEPWEKRQKLWEAASRDTDGQLFDANVTDLVASSPQGLTNHDGDDPFGYFKPEAERQPVAKSAPSPHGNSFETLSDILPSPAKQTQEENSDILPPGFTDAEVHVDHVGGDSFETLSDVLPSPAKQPPEIIDGDSPFSSSQISVSSDVQKPNAASAVQTQQSSAELPAAITTQPSRSTSKGASQRECSRPKYELYTDTQLSKEITSYGFKPVRKRTDMIALLDQCWQSKNRMVPAGTRTITTSAESSGVPGSATQSIASPKRPRGRPRKNSTDISGPQDPPPSAQPTESPKRPRGRPRKDSASSKTASPGRKEPLPSGQPVEPTKRSRGRPRKDSVSPSRASPLKAKAKKGAKTSKASVLPDPSTPPRKPTIPKTVVEIPDSASENGSEVSASPISSTEQTFSPPAGVDLSVSMEEDTDLSLTMTPDDEQTAFFDHITKAVTSAPRSTDPANPSWYEKILLYDPIVLEDFASWLNSGQLTRVGYDGEISPGMVKKWCESKSVCCLWRVNLRGKERKRY